MKNILKGLCALPFAAAAVCVVLFVGSLALIGIGLLVALACAAAPFLLRLAALAFIVFGTLWLLGAVVTAVQTTNNKN